MEMRPGIPTMEEYSAMLGSDLFQSIESYSDSFLKTHREDLDRYAARWVKDPLHQWSRQWEYPYVVQAVGNFVSSRPGMKTDILDAGSGVTFLPYYLASHHEDVRIHCCDSDKSLSGIYSAINSKTSQQVEFDVRDRLDLDYPDESFDLIYCVSVLEHIPEFEKTISSFFRVLRPNGCLVLTFDISVYGDADIPVEGAQRLLAELGSVFRAGDMPDVRTWVENPDAATLKKLLRRDRSLMPWRFPFVPFVKSLLKFRIPRHFMPELTFACITFTKNG
jgi:2-polyprenyl-3-methyl-5-hydroxy-6-metoxy-1,4-benzoquinol methylase